MPPKPIKLALIGATGLIGRTMLQVLEERSVQVAELFPVASLRSRGVKLPFQGREWLVSTLEDELWRNADYALLSPGAAVSRTCIPRLAEAGVICIDNSSAFRMDPEVPLIVPEVNPQALSKHKNIIANPNCSTIQMVVALQPLHQAFGLEEVVVATYQSASGAGQRGFNQLLDETAGKTPVAPPFPHPLFQNVIPAIGSFREDGYCQEEWKMVLETQKIMSLPSLKVFPTTVRVPIAHCHSEAVHATFQKPVTPVAARDLLRNAPGIIVLDDPSNNSYPLPLSCADRDEVYVGRIRQLPGYEQTLDLWIVADNRRKGAATNAVQILELLLKEP